MRTITTANDNEPVYVPVCATEISNRLAYAAAEGAAVMVDEFLQLEPLDVSFDALFSGDAEQFCMAQIVRALRHLSDRTGISFEKAIVDGLHAYSKDLT